MVLFDSGSINSGWNRFHIDVHYPDHCFTFISIRIPGKDIFSGFIGDGWSLFGAGDHLAGEVMKLPKAKFWVECKNCRFSSIVKANIFSGATLLE
jgi:hypothetical protein